MSNNPYSSIEKTYTGLRNYDYESLGQCDAYGCTNDAIPGLTLKGKKLCQECYYERKGKPNYA